MSDGCCCSDVPSCAAAAPHASDQNSAVYRASAPLSPPHDLIKQLVTKDFPQLVTHLCICRVAGMDGGVSASGAGEGGCVSEWRQCFLRCCCAAGEWRQCFWRYCCAAETRTSSRYSSLASR